MKRYFIFLLLFLSLSSQDASKWFKQSRLNVGADLLVSSTKGVTISDDARFTGASNLGVSFYIELKTSAGEVLAKGATVLTAAQIGTPLDNKQHILINSSGIWYISGVLQSGTLIRDWTVAGDIKVGQTNSPDFTISNLTFFDATATAKEADYIFVNGGVLPETLHADIVGHWPIQTTYDDGVNNVTHDVVEQYNYAKVTPLTANHGTFVVYTDAEIGVVNPSSQTVIKDFYDKIDLAKGILNQPTNHAGISFPIPGGTITAYPYVLFAEMEMNGSGFGLEAVIALADSTASDKLNGIRSQVAENYQIFGRNTTARSDDGSIIVDVAEGKRHFIAVNFISATSRKLYVNGAFDVEGTGNVPFFTPNKLGLLAFLDSSPGAFLINQYPRQAKIYGTLAEQDILDLTSGEQISNTPIFEAGIGNIQSADPYVFNIADKEGNVTLASVDWSGTLKNRVGVVEKESLIVPRIEALPIAASKDVNFGNVGSIKGITFFIKTATDNIELFELISADANSKISIVAGVLTFGSSFTNASGSINGVDQTNADIGKQLNLNSLNVVTIFFDTFNATNLITKFTDGSHLASVLIFDALPDRLSLLQARISNNVLYKNPSVKEQEDIKYGWNFNSSFFSGAVDLNSDIGILAASVNGFTDLADVQSNLVDINSLR